MYEIAIKEIIYYEALTVHKKAGKGARRLDPFLLFPFAQENP